MRNSVRNAWISADARYSPTRWLWGYELRRRMRKVGGRMREESAKVRGRVETYYAFRIVFRESVTLKEKAEEYIHVLKCSLYCCSSQNPRRIRLNFASQPNPKYGDLDEVLQASRPRRFEGVRCLKCNTPLPFSVWKLSGSMSSLVPDLEMQRLRRPTCSIFRPIGGLKMSLLVSRSRWDEQRQKHELRLYRKEIL